MDTSRQFAESLSGISLSWRERMITERDAELRNQVVDEVEAVIAKAWGNATTKQWLNDNPRAAKAIDSVRAVKIEPGLVPLSEIKDGWWFEITVDEKPKKLKRNGTDYADGVWCTGEDFVYHRIPANALVKWLEVK